MFILAKPPESNPAQEIGEILGYGLIAFFLILIVVSVRILMECVRHRYANPWLMGTLMLGSSVGPVFLILLALNGVIPEAEWFIVLPFIGIGVWFLSLILYTIVSHVEKRKETGREHEAAVAQRQAELNAWDASPQQLPGEPDPDLLDAAPPEAGHSTGPRRAVSLPANDSGGHRASEQTLKRVSAAKLAEAAKEKGPRADEVRGNPILPGGEVKIRCLACDKKMKADASKFRKQRRCPACKAEPFRYVTAV